MYCTQTHTRMHTHTHTHSCITQHQLPQLRPHTSGSVILTKRTKRNLSWNLGSQLLCTELPGRTMLQVRSWTGPCHSLADAQWSPMASPGTATGPRVPEQRLVRNRVFNIRYLNSLCFVFLFHVCLLRSNRVQMVLLQWNFDFAQADKWQEQSFFLCYSWKKYKKD